MRSLAISALWAVCTFLFEIGFLGLWNIWPASLHHWQLWFFPILLFVFSFVWQLLRHAYAKIIWTILVCAGLIGLEIFNAPWVNSQAASLVLDLRIEQQEEGQARNPLYPGSVLVADSPVLIYYLDDGSTPEKMPPDQLDSVAAFVAGLPEVLTERTAAIYLMEDGLFLQQNGDIENPGNVFGVSDSRNVSTQIRLIHQDSDEMYTYLKDGTLVFLSDPSFYSETIVHEMTHLFDLYPDDGETLLSDSRQLQDFYSRQPDLLGEYGSTSPAEYFAEAGVYYFLYPQLMQEKSPELYAWFDQIVQERS